jgi:glycyl-tRNA synthetase beta chain
VSGGELLLEVRTEEIPARMLPGAIRELGHRLFEELMARGVPPAEVETGYTPRRLWIAMRGLPGRERDRETLEVGPPAAAAFDAQGNPTAAALGFARKLGVDVSRLRRHDFSKDGQPTGTAASGPAASGGVATGAAKGGAKGGGKVEGERVVVELTVPGRETRAILAELIPEILRGLGWAKTMRWGAGLGPWVRPVHSVVALLDGEVVPCALFGVAAGRSTAGHPTLSPAPFEVAGIDDWQEKLAARGIVPSPRAREERLAAGMAERAAAHGGAVAADPELMAKLVAICEIPGVLEGAFDPALLELPREVLATSLRDHQSAFTVERDGRLAPIFLTVMDRPDDPAGRVRAGNEWVVAARLADASFFWRKDREQRLEERIAALDGIAFHPKLGSHGAKRGRLVALAAALADGTGLDEAERRALEGAAALAKCDLATEMVREFTSLQGVMGGVYARAEGLPEAVWTALYDQYLPAGADDALPRGRCGRLLALADRIDTLAGFFGLGLVPSGSKDPFGLRRAALAAVRLAVELGTAIDLRDLVRRAHAGYAGGLPKSAEETWALLRPFLAERLRYLLELEGFAYDEIDAALERAGEGFAHVSELRARVAALHAARAGRDFLAVVLAAKRIANITRGAASAASPDPAAFELDEERALHGAAASFRDELDGALGRGDYAAGLAAVARLAPALEEFFVRVLVLDPDERKRANRLALLAGLGASIARLADLSRLVVDKAEYR